MNRNLAKSICVLIGVLAGPLLPREDLLRAATGLDPIPPAYTAGSVVNAATQLPNSLAPDTIATVYGTGLSYTTRAVAPSDTESGSLPNNMDGVQVIISGVPAPLFFISPGQINFLIPPEFLAGDVHLTVFRSGLAGSPVAIHLDTFAPGFFVYNGNTLIATHADGRLITTASPAAPGEIVVFYASGLGPTSPHQTAGRLATHPTLLDQSSPLQVAFDGMISPAEDVFYAGIAPGFAGLYQINIRVPPGASSAPTVQLHFGSVVSPPATIAAVAVTR